MQRKVFRNKPTLKKRIVVQPIALMLIQISFDMKFGNHVNVLSSGRNDIRMLAMPIVMFRIGSAFYSTTITYCLMEYFYPRYVSFYMAMGVLPPARPSHVLVLLE